MARHERFLDPSDPVQAFARDLRELRRKAGDPPVEAFARALGCSHSTISAYLNGYRLPPAPQLRAFLARCDVPEAGLATWDERLGRARKAVTRYNALMARDEADWWNLNSLKEKILTDDEIRLLLPTNSAAEIVEVVNSLLFEDRRVSAVKLIRRAIRQASVPVTMDVMEALGEPGHGFYAESVVECASYTWESSSALFELVEALHDNGGDYLQTAYRNVAFNHSWEAVAGLLKMLRRAGRNNDILQILVAAATGHHRAEDISKLLKALREAGEEKAASDLLHQLCKNRPVHFIGNLAIRLRDTGQEDAAESLLGKARAALAS